MTTFRCSSLARYLACPGSRAAENAATFHESDNVETTSGKLVHQCLAIYAARAFESIAEAITVCNINEDSREGIVCRWFASEVNKIIIRHGGVTLSAIEQRIVEQFDSGHELSGQPDLVLWCNDGSIHVIDYKSGYADQIPAWENVQVSGYVSLVAIRHGIPEGGSIKAHIISAGSSDVTTTTEYFAGDIENAINQINEAISNCSGDHPARITGEHCKYCPASGNPVCCPESCSASFEEQSLPVEHVPAEVLAKVVSLYDAATVAENNIKAFKDWVKSTLESGVEIPGLELKAGSKTRSIEDVNAFFACGVNHGWWKSDDFLQAVSVSIPKAEALAKSSTGLKGKKFSEVWDNGTSGLIAEVSRAPSVRRVK